MATATFGQPPGSHESCAVRFWEDDAIQLQWPDYVGGANGPSLIDAQQAYAEVGASEPRFKRLVRGARADEPLDEGWSVIDPAVDHFEVCGVTERPRPVDPTILYW